MAASVFDSPLFSKLFPTGEAGRLFTDSAMIRSMMLVEGALAKVQGDLGVIPQESAAAIHRASLELQIDPGELANATGQNGVCIPALVASFRKKMEAPEHAQYLHWGATSQDIIDSALMLRLRQLLAIAEQDLRSIVSALADQAEQHAETTMTARTYGQHATPTSWGAVLATWGNPLLDLLDALPDLRKSSLVVSLSGAAGTAAALGENALQIRTALAQSLGLADPGRSWHVERAPIVRTADWLCAVSATLAQMGANLVVLSSSDIREIKLASVGGSSTMPQKQNPVGPSELQALGTMQTGLRATMTTHLHQRDGAAWFAEWMGLPQICLNTASALVIAKDTCASMSPNIGAMNANLQASNGLIHGEALAFALAKTLPRPEAQDIAKTLCTTALNEGKSLETVARSAYPELPEHLFDDASQIGQAAEEARAFVHRAKAI